MRWLILGLIVLLGLLQYRLWIGDGSLEELHALRAQIADYRTELDGLKARNLALAAEVQDLKDGLEAIEDRARSELGMIQRGEVFLQVIEKPEGWSEVPRQSIVLVIRCRNSTRATRQSRPCNNNADHIWTNNPVGAAKIVNQRDDPIPEWSLPVTDRLGSSLTRTGNRTTPTPCRSPT
jgi:cell division protein FtsB